METTRLSTKGTAFTIEETSDGILLRPATIFPLLTSKRWQAACGPIGKRKRYRKCMLPLAGKCCVAIVLRSLYGFYDSAIVHSPSARAHCPRN
jgi:hypothetical protein